MGHDTFSAPSITAQRKCYSSQFKLKYQSLTHGAQADVFLVSETNVLKLKKRWHICSYVPLIRSDSIINFIIITIIIKFLPVHNLKAHKEYRSVVPLIINLGSKWGGWHPAKNQSLLSLRNRHQIHCGRLGVKSKSFFYRDSKPDRPVCDLDTITTTFWQK
jgi:hypothetical protein